MAPELPQFWLALQCSMIPDLSTGAVVRRDEAGSETAAAAWPEGSACPPALLAVARMALDSGAPAVRSHAADPAGGRGQTVLALPLNDGEHPASAVVIGTTVHGEQHQRAVMQMLQWGAQWFGLLAQREKASNERRSGTVMDVVAAGLRHEGPQATLVTAGRIGRALSCHRVAVAFHEDGRLRLAAISDTASFDPRSNLARELLATMQEALEERQTIQFPADGATGPPGLLTAAHAEYARAHGVQALLTVPVVQGEDVRAVLALERRNGPPFDEADVALAEAIAAVAGPVLALKRDGGRWLGAKRLGGLGRFGARLLGPRHLRTKLATGLFLATASVLAFGTGAYHITGDATVEGSVQRVIVAPRDGYIASGPVRAGDFVRAGEALGTFDVSQLELERRRIASRREQRLKGYREALAKRDRARMRILDAQIAEADAELDLIETQISRSQLVAPFDGLVVAGDLSNRLGAPVKRGQVLFKVAPLEAYRAVVMVDEREIADVAVGQSGKLALASLPGEQLPIVVERLTPVAEVEEGQNRFRVEARLRERYSVLRPGMRGVGKIAAGERRLGWIWGRELVSWLRLAAWRWWR